jgi:hypothetical protein|tara:strand:- start:186 stop:359 length:174 start_codon:yes stop_codon:yes gene_type:complete
MTYTLNLTDAERDTLIEILESDCQSSGFDIPDFRDVDLMTFYTLRAKMLKDLREAAQ